MKKCCKCKKIQPFECFCKDKSRHGGLSPQCKSCAKAWRLANREHLNAYFIEYNRENKAQRDASAAANYANKREQKTQAARLYRRNNPEKIHALNEAYYEANADSLKEKQRERNRKNPLAKRAHEENRRARKKNAGGRHTVADINFLFDAQKGKCAHMWCRESIRDGYHIDHVIPLALGGRNDRPNLQLLCKTCNHKKRAKHPIDFAQMHGMLL